MQPYHAFCIPKHENESKVLVPRKAFYGNPQGLIFSRWDFHEKVNNFDCIFCHHTVDRFDFALAHTVPVNFENKNLKNKS